MSQRELLMGGSALNYIYVYRVLKIEHRVLKIEHRVLKIEHKKKTTERKRYMP